MLDTVDFNHVQHISFTQSRLTDAVSVILNGLLSYEHPPNVGGIFLCHSFFIIHYSLFIWQGFRNEKRIIVYRGLATYA